MIKNWKTTVLGLVVVIGSIAQGALDRDAHGRAMLELLAGVGLIAARDHDR